jgi:hypothetical protein
MKKAILPVIFSAAALVAQTPQVVENKQIHLIAAPTAGATAMSGFTFVSAEMGFETTLVKGVPFTGDFVTENVQVLADGNRIKAANTTSYARDGEGRTRREITINAIGPLTGGGEHKTIFIHDPVAKIDYILDPQNKTARKINLGAATAKVNTFTTTRDTGNVVITRRVEDGKGAMITENIQGPVELPRMPMPPAIAGEMRTGTVMAQSIDIGHGPAATSTNVKTDDLGKRIIEGVEATGTSSTITIPAGQIGNDRALDTVSERWFSNELKTTVMTTRRDPRMGESTYKLTNLRRGEPSRLLFEVPSDYKIVTEDNVGPNIIRLRVNGKQEE